MSLHANSKPEGNRIKWKLARGDAFTLGTLGQPLAPPVYHLCIYDEVAGVPALVASLTVAHASAWQVVGSRSLRYHDPEGVSDGVQTLNFKPGEQGSGQVNLTALGAAIPMPMAISATQFFAQDTQVLAQLINDDTSVCWSATFPTAHRNDGDHYMATWKTH